MKSIAFFLLIFFCGLTTGCGAQTTTLDGATKEAVLAYSETKTDGLLLGLNSNDYATFSQDFDTEMLKAFTPSEFDKLKENRDAKLGDYVSRQVKSVIQNGDFYAVNYDAVFKKDAAVKMRVVFRIAEPHLVSGLWFDK